MSRLHPREQIVGDARFDLTVALGEWVQRHDLTDAEYLSLVTHELSSRVLELTKMQIRTERHGDCDRPGGLA